MISISVKRLADIDDVFENIVWPITNNLTYEMIEQAVSERNYRPDCSHMWTDTDMVDGKCHAERIAYLVNHWHSSDEDPISLECTPGGLVIINDGNHRLWAAAFRGDATIQATISGFLDTAERELGVIIP